MDAKVCQLVLTAWLDVAVLPPDEGVHGVAPGAALDPASVPAEVGGVPHLKVTSKLMFQILLPSQCNVHLREHGGRGGVVVGRVRVPGLAREAATCRVHVSLVVATVALHTRAWGTA